MPIYHNRLLPSGRQCNRPFVQARCPVCGKVVGFQIRADMYWKNTEAQTFCSESCVQESKCSWDLFEELVAKKKV